MSSPLSLITNGLGGVMGGALDFITNGYTWYDHTTVIVVDFTSGALIINPFFEFSSNTRVINTYKKPSISSDAVIHNNVKFELESMAHITPVSVFEYRSNAEIIGGNVTKIYTSISHSIDIYTTIKKDD